MRHMCGYSMSVGPQEMRFTIRASLTNMRYAKQTLPAVIYQRLMERECQASTELHPDFTLLLRILPFVYYNSPSPNEYKGIAESQVHTTVHHALVQNLWKHDLW